MNKKTLPDPLPYQKPLLNKVQEAFKTHDRVVLAASCGSGKTIMGLIIAGWYTAKNESVLILTHNQNGLKDQWNEEREKFGVADPRIVVAIPSGCTEDGLKPEMEEQIEAAGVPVGLLIVDEAHEYYFAEKLVPNIKKFTQPKKELLLTGTPSPFVRANDDAKEAGLPEPYKIIIYSALDAYKAGQLQDTFFGMVRSSYKLEDSDYNEKGDVNENFVFTTKATNKTVDALVEAMINRLTGMCRTSLLGTTLLDLTGINRVSNAFRMLDKTLIATKSAKQAFDVRDALKRKGVVALVSECQEDVDSDSIREFKADPSIPVLIVVRRATLGFNMKTLCNVIDLRCSRNIDVIYQLYARVLRLHPDKRDKFYFRVSNYFNAPVDSYYLQAALCLSNPDFISKYNGRNLGKMEIPVRKERTPKTTESKTGRKTTKDESDESTQEFIPNEEILGLKLMSEALLNPSNPLWTEYEYCRFGDVMRKQTGKTFFHEDWQERFEVCKQFYSEQGRFPSTVSKNKEEKSLGRWLNGCCRSVGERSRPEVRAWRDEIGGSVLTSWQERFEVCKQFYSEQGRFPSQVSKNKEEKSLGFWLSRCCCSVGEGSRPEVRAWRDSTKLL